VHNDHQKAIATMTSQQPGEIDAVTAVGHLVTQLGVAALVALIADITEQQSDYFLLSGERQKATQCMRHVRILQKTTHVLRNPSQ
jgi:Tfp pilus assembly protein PilN